jgi:hypothetical protein
MSNFQFLSVLIGIIGGLVTVAFKAINSLERTRIAIGAEKAKQNSVGEDKITALTAEISEMRRLIVGNKQRIDELEIDWDKWKREQRESSDTITAQAKLMTRMLEDWKDTINETRKKF